MKQEDFAKNYSWLLQTKRETEEEMERLKKLRLEACPFKVDDKVIVKYNQGRHLNYMTRTQRIEEVSQTVFIFKIDVTITGSFDYKFKQCKKDGTISALNAYISTYHSIEPFK